AAFGATRSLSNVTPLPSNLWKHAGLSDLLSVFAPRVEFEVADHLGYLTRTLTLTFRPNRMEDFTPDGVVRGIPELAAFVDLRESLVGVQRKKVKAEEFDTVADLDAVPLTWKRRAEAASRASPQALATFIGELDAALSRQCEAVFANERLKAFQADWLGLQFVASNMDFANGSRIELY